MGYLEDEKGITLPTYLSQVWDSLPTTVESLRSMCMDRRTLLYSFNVKVDSVCKKSLTLVWWTTVWSIKKVISYTVVLTSATSMRKTQPIQQRTLRCQVSTGLHLIRLLLLRARVSSNATFRFHTMILIFSWQSKIQKIERVSTYSCRLHARCHLSSKRTRISGVWHLLYSVFSSFSYSDTQSNTNMHRMS